MFYRVPFQLVPEVISTRGAYLSRGMAYVYRDQLASIVSSKFR